ncbi:MAG: PilZ domain-containing protein [Proteobacteria bacterium]|nr:PilZ domain-containing protein [Pseudomonadota bacterium]MBU1162087.1 PilZ domain-containing protein [Pseudomonadota bacterium]
MENNDNELGRNEVRAFIFEIIDDMSDTEMRQLLKDLEKWQKSKNEKRKYPRRSTLIDITYLSDQRRIFEDFVRNISAGGLFIETNFLSELGQKLTMTFSHPGSGDPIKVLGKVIRVDSGGIGVKFNKLLSDF